MNDMLYKNVLYSNTHLDLFSSVGVCVTLVLHFFSKYKWRFEVNQPNQVYSTTFQEVLAFQQIMMPKSNSVPSKTPE